MTNPFPVDTVPWRVLLLRRNATEVLTLETDSGLVLPEIEIPQGCRVPKSLNQAIRERWNVVGFSLFPLTLPQNSVPRFYVVEALEHDAPPEATRWLNSNQAALSSFCERSDFEAIQTLNQQLSASTQHGRPGPFAKPGWLGACRQWMAECLKSIPLQLTGGFVQCNASPTFSLIRFETNEKAVWFKAVGPPNTREYDLTLFLSARLPEFLPEILAAKPEWNAWLALEADGSTLSQTSQLADWIQSVRALASLQRASETLATEFLDRHARDVRPNMLVAAVPPYIRLISELMARQVELHPPRLVESEIQQLKCDLLDAINRMTEDNTPDAVLHLDLNPDNVVVCAGRTCFLDWAEGSVGNPWLSFAYFIEHFRRHFLDAERAIPVLTLEYLKAWQPDLPLEPAQVALANVALVALFAYAISCGLDLQTIQPNRSLAGYHRSLARRMKRYAEKIRSDSLTIAEVIA